MKKINITFFIITIFLILSACSNSIIETNEVENMPTNNSKIAVEAGQAKLSPNGKEIEIGLIGGADLNIGKEQLEKDKTITFSLESKEESEIVIGIMSVSTKEIYSDVVKNGTGIVDILVPQNDEYRIYVKNNDTNSVNLNIELNIQLDKID